MTPNTSKLAGHGEFLPDSLWEGNPNMADPSRRPYVPSEFKTLLEEPGRRIATPIGPVNRNSTNYALAERCGVLTLFISFGNGTQKSFPLYDEGSYIDILMCLTSDQRFAFLAGLHTAHAVGFEEGRESMELAIQEGRVSVKVKHGRKSVVVASKAEGVSA
jgi:hypothetical protein